MPRGIYTRKPFMKRVGMSDETKSAIERAVQMGLPDGQIVEVLNVSVRSVRKAKRQAASSNGAAAITQRSGGKS